jgi:hypothetical protein
MAARPSIPRLRSRPPLAASRSLSLASPRGACSGENRHSLQVGCAFVLILAATSCHKTSTSRQLADRFMELYYAQKSVAEAARLCAGAARTKLEAELRAIQGVRPDPSVDEPRVTFSLTASANPTATQATYTYLVTPHTSGIGNVVATLMLTDEGGHWLVTSLKEDHRPPPS